MCLLKKVGTMALVLAMALGVTACGHKVTISAENIDDKGDTTQTKKYMIATNISSPPFEFRKFLGDYVGIDVDLLNAIAEKQGFTYEFVPMTLNEVLQSLETGEVDGAMAGIFITDERKKSMITQNRI